MKVRIEVTQEDIDRGTPGSVHSCAVQRAVQRHVNVPVWAGPNNIGVTAMGFANTPEAVREWIFAFDHDRRGVQPMSFDLEIPDELVKKEVAS